MISISILFQKSKWENCNIKKANRNTVFYKKNPLKHLLKQHRCKFKIDKITYSKSRTSYYVTKNSPSLYP